MLRRFNCCMNIRDGWPSLPDTGTGIHEYQERVKEIKRQLSSQQPEGQVQDPRASVIPPQEPMNPRQGYVNRSMEVQDVSGMDRTDHWQDYQASGRSGQRVKVEDALTYCHQVKNTFENQLHVYKDFLDILRRFKSQEINTPGVIAKVSELFRGYPNLIVGFNMFLPSGDKIEISMDISSHGNSYVVNAVKTGSEGRPMSSVNTTSQDQHGVMVPYQGIQSRQVSGQSNLEIHGAPERITPPLPHSQAGSSTAGSREAKPSTSSNHSSFSQFEQLAQQNQPAAFGHAIKYITEIKNRFQNQPGKYQQFLDILHAYKRQQESLKNGIPLQVKALTEDGIYRQVSKVFEGHADLIQQFIDFLPVATKIPSTVTGMRKITDWAKKTVKANSDIQPVRPKPVPVSRKRPSAQSGPKPKKMKTLPAPSANDIPLGEADKYGTMSEFVLFDKVRTALSDPEAYERFLRCLKSYNDGRVGKPELLHMVKPFLAQHYKLLDDFMALINYKECLHYVPLLPTGVRNEGRVLEIERSSCMRLGASYCAVPGDHSPPICSGRTNRENEVLNDLWVSYPNYSEDPTFGTSRKTNFEENLYRIEDERYELDNVIESNLATTLLLNKIVNRMSKMSPEESDEFELDDTFAGTSDTIHRNTIRRLYGDHRAHDIIETLKEFPKLAVPLVVKRLKSKHIELTEERKEYKDQWRVRMEKNYLKSLDHQGVAFKQTDLRALRPKALTNEIESEAEARNLSLAAGTSAAGPGLPHLLLDFGDRDGVNGVLVDACNLLLHHARRQPGMQTEDMRKVKQILKHLLFDIFHQDRLELSDDEDEQGPPDDEGASSASKFVVSNQGGTKKNRNTKKNKINETKVKSGSGSQGNAASLNGAKGRGVTKTHKSRSSQKKGIPSNCQQNSEDLLASISTTKRKSDPIANTKRFHSNDFTANRDGMIKTLSWQDLNAAFDQFKARRTDQEIVVDDLNTGSHSRVEATNKVSDAEETIVPFYANRSWYLFLRLHQVLCDRLQRMLKIARKIITDKLEEDRPSNESPAVRLAPRAPKEIEPDGYYANFLEMVKDVLNGNIDSVTYEDTIRQRFGVQAYMSYTLDKVIGNAVRQLHSLVTDETSMNCLKLYYKYHKEGGAAGQFSGIEKRFVELTTYRKSAQKYCENDMCTRVSVSWDKRDMVFRMGMELLSSGSVVTAAEQEREAKLCFISTILHSTDKNARDAREVMGLKPLFLDRNFSCERKSKPRGEHDYIAREYHQGKTPKYYCPKERVPQGADYDVALDLLQNPDKYKYLYDRDIMITTIIPPEYVSVPYVVRNALTQKPKGKYGKRDIGMSVAKLRQIRFDQWHQAWRRNYTTNEERRLTDLWFAGNETNLIIPQFVTLPEAPFRTVKKFVSNKQSDCYAFPTSRKAKPLITEENGDSKVFHSCHDRMLRRKRLRCIWYDRDLLGLSYLQLSLITL